MESAFLIYHFISHLSYMPSYIRYILSIRLPTSGLQSLSDKIRKWRFSRACLALTLKNLKHRRAPNKNASADTTSDVCVFCTKLGMKIFKHIVSAVRQKLAVRICFKKIVRIVALNWQSRNTPDVCTASFSQKNWRDAAFPFFIQQ